MLSKESHLYYGNSINRTLTYIFANITRGITLDELAKVSCFSKFHFLRLFQAVVGESVGEFISRIRIEKAAYHLIYNPSASITTISMDCGFSSSQNFAKSFRARYKMSPGEYRKTHKNRPLEPNSNPGNRLSNGGKENEIFTGYFDNPVETDLQLETCEEVAAQVKVESISDLTVAYVRKNANYTPQIIASAFRELYNWGFPRGYITSGTVGISVYWDNVAVTPVDKRRFDACIPVDSTLAVSNPVHKQVIKGGLYAVYHSEIKNYDFYFHWNRFLKFWFPSSGFIPDDRPCYERICNIFDPKMHNSLSVDICVPIKQL